jgi:hypothetical protein
MATYSELPDDFYRELTNRQADRHKLSRSERRHAIPRQLLCIDGEGCDDPITGRQNYNLLACAGDNNFAAHITANRLTTEQCLQFILSLPKGALVFGYAFRYDVAKICEDLPYHILQRLQDKGRARYAPQGRKGTVYHISYLPGRRFSITKGKDKTTTRSVYDIFGFFQQSFVASITQWEIGTQAEREAIKNMKDQRSAFQAADFHAVLEYCYHECRLGVALMHKFMDACKEADLIPRHYWGAGAIAAAAMQKLKIDEFMAPPPEYAEIPLSCAYHGGRTEIAQSGRFLNVHRYDIRSAYPDMIRYLPCLKHMDVELTLDYDSNALALWYLEWDDIENLWPPFPVRDKNGGVHWSTGGEGWYWSIEANYPIQLFGDKIKVHLGIKFTPGCDEKPFSRVDEWYEVRRIWNVTNPGAAKVMKLALNSLYGKTAQTIGWGSDGLPPKYHSLVWAGMTTANCRAKIYRAIQQNPEAVISCATDGLLTIEPLHVSIGDKLGEWEYDTANEAWVFQSGVYMLLLNDGSTWYHRNRGCNVKEIDWFELMELMKQGKIQYKYPSTRFVGIGGALMRKDWHRYLGQWITAERVMKLGHQRRFLDKRTKGEIPQTRWMPEGRCKVASMPYVKTNSYREREVKIEEENVLYR